MRSRSIVALGATLLVVATFSWSSPAFAASTSGGIAVAQPEDAEEGGGSGGQDEPEAESGASEEETEGATPEAGPPWTYQMARISLLGLAALLLACAYLYWRLVAQRRRGES